MMMRFDKIFCCHYLDFFKIQISLAVKRWHREFILPFKINAYET